MDMITLDILYSL